MPQDTKKEILDKLISSDILVDEPTFNKIRNLEGQKAEELYLKIKDAEKKEKILEILKSSLDEKEDRYKVKILNNYDYKPEKKTANSFVKYYNARFRQISSMIERRSEMKSIVSISRLYSKFHQGGEREKVSFIGMVLEKSLSKNGNIMLTLEDKTGTIKTIITKRNESLFEEAKELVLDDIIGINGSLGKGVVFADSIIFPDIPTTKEIKKSPEEVYAAFISDLHVGEKGFYEKEFLKFISWLNCEAGNDSQKEIAKKVKYLFVTGDIIGGVGVYPNQEEDLSITDVARQYEKTAELFKKIPKRIKIIMCPGNHDPQRIAEPQVPLDKTYAKDLVEMENITMVSSPSLVNIHSSKNFPGFNVLLYHGNSFPYFLNNVESILKEGGMHRPDLLMAFLLKRRHLAPTHGSTRIIPDTIKDPLVIEKVPDIFVTGHIHTAKAARYKNVILLNSSCWMAKTEYQEKQGFEPIPCRVPLVNLKNSKVKMLNFASQ